MSAREGTAIRSVDAFPEGREDYRLTETQVAALEKAQLDTEAHGEFESERPGYCVAQDTSYVGMLKGVGRVRQQTMIDTYSKVGFSKLYTERTAIVGRRRAQRQGAAVLRGA